MPEQRARRGADARTRLHWLAALPAVLVLAGCQALPTRPAPAQPAVAAPPAAVAEQKLPALSAATAAAARPLDPAADGGGTAATRAPAPPEPSTWEVLRDGFALPGCDYAPQAAYWTRRYAGHPRRFAATLDQMLPALDWTARTIAAAGLPTELALLPIVESHFRPHQAPHARPAGIWQMIADTARSAGVRIDPWFDGRLNLAASTAGAIHLFDRYLERFGDDWRLALVAYNAGEYRVRRALQDRSMPGPAFADLTALPLPASSMDYIGRLLALACLVREPDRFDLDLPTLEPERRLVAVALPDVAGAGLARALSGLDRERFDQVNGGLTRGRTPPGTPFTLLVRQDRAPAASELLARVPAPARIDWHRRRLHADERMAQVAAGSGVPAAVLARINGLAEDGEPAADRAVWLPGTDRSATVAGVAAGGAGDGVHVVRTGDSLWSIARRHGLTVADLLRYNRLDHSRIRPGQRLLLQPP